MLPFLKKQVKQQTGVLIKQRPSDEKPIDSEKDPLEQCAKALLDAVEAKDIKRVAIAIREAFDTLEMEPHDEGPYTNEDEDRDY